MCSKLSWSMMRSGRSVFSKNKKVMASKLDRCCRQKDNRFGVVTEEPHRLVAESVLISDVVRLVHDDEIKTWRWVQIQKPFFSLPLAARPRTIKKDFVEQGIGDNHSLVLFRPDPFQVHLVDAVP